MSRPQRKRRIPQRYNVESDISGSKEDLGKQKPNPVIKNTKKPFKRQTQNNLTDDLNKTQNKFFKTKMPGAKSVSTIQLKQETAIKKKIAINSNKKTKKKESLGCATPLRQTTLSESYHRSSLLSRLRPRDKIKNYKDSSSISILIEKSILPEKRKSFVLLEKINVSKGSKEPIYKAIKLDEKSTEDKDSIYDFRFDNNDPAEKPKNKKKKKVTRKPRAARKKIKPLLKNNHNNNNETSEKPNIEVSETKVVSSKEEKKPTNTKKLEPLLEEIENVEESKSEKSEELKKAAVELQDFPAEKNAKEKAARAKVSNVQTLTGDKKISFMPNLSLFRPSSIKFNPFCSTQSIFKPRNTLDVKEMMEHSLLNKSLSPIKRDLEPFDAASPWRPSLPNAFSSVKQVVQSTPQIKRNYGKFTQGFRIDENEKNDQNAEAESSMIKLPIKRPPNPLGVRILNAENIQTSNSNRKEPLIGQETTTSVSKIGTGRKVLGVISNYGENKENSVFGDRLYKSPKKNEKAAPIQESPAFKRKNNPLNSRGEITDGLLQQKKSSEMYGDENSTAINETKLLKQSNLNTFLNLVEVPERISINTKHGIFGDSYSTPIVKSLTPKIQIQANIDNCFGFDDDCSTDAQDSPVKLENKQGASATPVKKIFQRLKGHVLTKEQPSTARISLGEIKNTLYPKKEKRLEKVENTEEINTQSEINMGTKTNTASQKTKVKSKRLLNPIDFSDTFDILSESGQGEDNKSMGSDIALFTDLEPIRFTKPPRWSYGKKRERKQYWLSDEDEHDNEENKRNEPVLKKRRVTKLNKVEEKKINEWVKSVNETFQEIDEFDLVVEKLS